MDLDKLLDEVMEMFPQLNRKRDRKMIIGYLSEENKLDENTLSEKLSKESEPFIQALTYVALNCQTTT